MENVNDDADMHVSLLKKLDNWINVYSGDDKESLSQKIEQLKTSYVTINNADTGRETDSPDTVQLKLQDISTQKKELLEQIQSFISDNKIAQGGRRRSSSARKSSSRRGRRSSKKRGTQRKQKRRQRRISRRAY